MPAGEAQVTIKTQFQGFHPEIWVGLVTIGREADPGYPGISSRAQNLLNVTIRWCFGQERIDIGRPEMEGPRGGDSVKESGAGFQKLDCKRGTLPGCAWLPSNFASFIPALSFRVIFSFS